VDFVQKYMMNFDSRNLPQLSVDCLIVGAGVAGLIAAWYAAERGCRVMLAVKDTLQDSNTNKAQGELLRYLLRMMIRRCMRPTH